MNQSTNFSLPTLTIKWTSAIGKLQPVRLPKNGSRALALVFCLVFHASTLKAEHHAVVVTGLGGTEEYAQSFNNTSQAIVDALQSLEAEENRIVHLPATATREDILTAIDSASSRLALSGPSSVFSLFLVGHGNADSSGWRFNITGPDLTTSDIVAALNPLLSGQQLVVLAASASGSALETLAQPQRVVVTATKSGGEMNAVRFPGFFAEALVSESSDYDRNEILTIAEAFRFADTRTAEYYELQNLLAPEHARLRGEDAADIPIALLGSLKNAADEPQIARLLDQRLELENEFKQLKSEKDEMNPTDYYSDLETLLIRIARLQQSIDTVTGWSDDDTES